MVFRLGYLAIVHVPLGTLNLGKVQQPTHTHVHTHVDTHTCCLYVFVTSCEEHNTLLSSICTNVLLLSDQLYTNVLHMSGANKHVGFEGFAYYNLLKRMNRNRTQFLPLSRFADCETFSLAWCARTTFLCARDQRQARNSSRDIEDNVRYAPLTQDKQ